MTFSSLGLTANARAQTHAHARARTHTRTHSLRTRIHSTRADARRAPARPPACARAASAYQKVMALFRRQSLTVSSALLIGFTQTQPTDLSQKQLKTPFIFLQRAHGLPRRVTANIGPSSSVCDFKLRGRFPYLFERGRT